MVGVHHYSFQLPSGQGSYFTSAKSATSARRRATTAAPSLRHFSRAPSLFQPSNGSKTGVGLPGSVQSTLRKAVSVQS